MLAISNYVSFPFHRRFEPVVGVVALEWRVECWPCEKAATNFQGKHKNNEETNIHHFHFQLTISTCHAEVAEKTKLSINKLKKMRKRNYGLIACYTSFRNVLFAFHIALRIQVLNCFDGILTEE